MNKWIWYFSKVLNEWINEYDILARFDMNKYIIFWKIWKQKYTNFYLTILETQEGGHNSSKNSWLHIALRPHPK